MRVLTINLSEKDIDFLDTLKAEGIFPSRSEIIRVLIHISMPTLIDQIEFQKKVIKGDIVPISNKNIHCKDIVNVGHRAIPLQKADVRRFNKSQDVFYIVPNGNNPNEYKILKRV